MNVLMLQMILVATFTTMLRLWTVLLPFDNRLRLPRWAALLTTVAVSVMLGGILYLFWPASNFAYSTYMACWLLGMYAICGAMIRGGGLKLLFVLLLTVRFSQMADMWALSMRLCWLGHLSGAEALTVQLRLTMLLHAVGTPVWMLFMRRKVVPAIARHTNEMIWRLLWLIPAAFIIANQIMREIILLIEPAQLMLMTLVWTIGGFIGYYASVQMVSESNRRALLEENVTRQQLREAAQRGHYHMLEETVATVRREQHDLRHHLALLKEFCNRQDYAGASAYLQEMMVQQAEATPALLCDHGVLDYLLRQYSHRAELAHVTMTVDARVTDETRVSAVDLAVVVSNLLENALLAATEAEAGWMRVRIMQDGDNAVMIHVENSFIGAISMDRRDRLLSCRHPGSGIGTASVRACAERHGGMARFSWQNNIFSADARVCAAKNDNGNIVAPN